MSWSLELRNGDLALGGTRLGQVTGAQKLGQDLRCKILEPRGNDDMHPSLGSTLDGGIDDFGNDVPSVIGTADWEFVSLRVQKEIQRITNEHQKAQLTRAQDDRYKYGESTLLNGELLVAVRSVQFGQVADTLFVQVEIVTGQGDVTSLLIPIGT